MKKLLLATAASLVLAPGVISAAYAADLPPRPYTKAPPPVSAPAVVYNWTGFYIGGHIGGAFGSDDSLQGSDGRFAGGVQGGFDYQFANNWVLGIEANYSWLASAGNGVVFPAGTVASLDNRGLGSVTGRLGYTWGPALLYAKGGYAFRDRTLDVTFNGVSQPFGVTGNHQDGYTVGAGLEYMFSPNWSAKIEYQYYNFGNTTFTGGPVDIVGTSFRNDEHTVKAGLNYRFGWGGPVANSY